MSYNFIQKVKKIMTKRILITLGLVALLAYIALSSEKYTDSRKHDVTREVVNRLVKNHYLNKNIDDAFSKSLFNEYLKAIDPSKLYLLQSDVNELKTNEMLLDNELKRYSSDFSAQCQQALKKRIQDIQQFVPSLLNKPFDFSKDEWIETDPEKLNWSNTPADLKERWRIYLKYQTLINYMNMSDTASKNNTMATLKFDKKLEEKARNKTRQSTEVALGRIANNMDELFDMYMNTVATIFDPHSNYLPPEEKENFDITMSGKLEGIGAVLSEEDSFIKVNRIIPGSAAARQGELEENDIILKVAEGNGEPVDITAMRVKDAVKYIRGKKGTLVRLTIKKTDGRIKIIPIMRDIVIIEDTYAKMFILHHKTFNQNFAYIKLPSFYRDFEDARSRNATDDIRKALLEANRQQTAGVILDLRNNGGGSLKDAIDTAGLFIKTGPIVQVKDRFNQSQVYPDNDPAYYYDGPVVVLINEFSASASEILAGALQDYHRAIIVGSNQSFGKGTVQSLINLDPPAFLNLNKKQVLGSLKLTFQKFFRINGETNQYKGIVSDITLPELHAYKKVGERFLPYSMPATTTNATIYTAQSNSPEIVQQLRTNSEKRVSELERFKEIISYSQNLVDRSEKTTQPLQLTKAINQQRALEKDSKAFKADEKADPALELLPTELHEPTKEYKKDFDTLVKDPYISESIAIIEDLIKMPIPDNKKPFIMPELN